MIDEDEIQPASFRKVEDANVYIGIIRRTYVAQVGKREDRIGVLESEIAQANERVRVLKRALMAACSDWIKSDKASEIAEAYIAAAKYDDGS
jgi:hypothetical protein